MQSHVDRSFAAGAAGNEGVDFSVPVSDSVAVKSALAPTTPARTTLWVAGDDSTGEHIPDSDKKRIDSVCERMAD